MRIIINHSSMIPIYEQIVDQIKKQINDHILQENDPLPSVRLLSKELRISALTVKKAYDTLEEEVLTKTIHGKGTFVLAVNKDLLEEAKKEIETEDSKRYEFHKYYTNEIWGMSNGYELCLDEGILGIDGCVKMILDYLKIRNLI